MSFKKFEDWARGLTSGSDAPGDPTQGDTQMRARADALASSMGVLHNDETTLPASVTYRPNGSFSDPYDLADYLQRGGLLIIDSNGDVQPHPIVHIVRLYDPDADSVEYETYIDEDTESAT